MKQITIVLFAIALFSCEKEVGVKLCDCTKFNEQYNTQTLQRTRSHYEYYKVATPEDEDCSIHDESGRYTTTLHMKYYSGKVECN